MTSLPAGTALTSLAKRLGSLSTRTESIFSPASFIR